MMSMDNEATKRPSALDTTMHPSEPLIPSAGMDGTVRADGIGADEADVQDNFFVLKGVTYRNVQSLSDNSGEAQVFLVERNGESYVLTIHIGLTKVVHLYYHLKVEVQNRLQYLTVHIEIGIVHFQYIFLVVFLNQENLGLTCILAQY